jgi:hypothetical protein
MYQMDTPRAPLLDLPAFLHILRTERRTAMLIHGAPLCGKSTFARQLVDKLDGGYMNVLETISQRKDLSRQIDEFDPSTFRLLTLEFAKSNPKDIIILDELDFLFPVWGDDLSPFQSMLYELYNPSRATAFVFFAQSRPEWESWVLETSGRLSRVVEFANLKSL